MGKQEYRCALTHTAFLLCFLAKNIEEISCTEWPAETYLGSFLTPSWFYTLCNVLILIDSNTSCNPTVAKYKRSLSWLVFLQVPNFGRLSVAKKTARSPAPEESQSSKVSTPQTCNASPLSSTSREHRAQQIHSVQSIKVNLCSVLEMLRLPKIASVHCNCEQKSKQAHRALCFLIKTWDNFQSLITLRYSIAKFRSGL